MADRTRGTRTTLATLTIVLSMLVVTVPPGLGAGSGDVPEQLPLPGSHMEGAIEQELDAWPMYGLDARNTGSHATVGPGSGEELWRHETGESSSTSTNSDQLGPAVANGTVYVGSRTGLLHALDNETGEEVWSVAMGGLILGAPAVVDETVYVGLREGGRHGDLYALDAGTGEEIWRFDAAWVVGGPTVVDGTVYFSSYWEHSVYAVDAETGEEEWRHRLSGRGHGHPTVVDGTVFVGDGLRSSSFYAIDADTGDRVWRTDIGDVNSRLPPAVAGESVYGTSKTGAVFALDVETGEEKWTFSADGGIRSAPTISGDTVHFGSRDGNVYALDRETGQERWRFETGDDVVWSSPAVAGDTIYFGSSDRNVYAIDAGDGTERWRFEADAPVRTSPAVVCGVLYVSSEAGTVYALDAGGGVPGVDALDDLLPLDELLDPVLDPVGDPSLGGSSCDAETGATDPCRELVDDLDELPAGAVPLSEVCGLLEQREAPAP